MTDTLASIEAGNTAGSEKRRSSRVPLSVPITVSGVDALGEPFRELTTTLSVSCNGCKYKSKNYVQRDSLVTVEVAHPNPRLSPRVVKGRARWVQRPRNLREQYEIGLELLVSGNIWGLNSPPPDWFPHPDDEALLAGQAGVMPQAVTPASGAPGNGATVSPSVEAVPGDFDAAEYPPDTGTQRSVSAAAFEEIDISGAIGFTPEESEPEPPAAPLDASAQLQETIAASLRAMVNRIAEEATADIAARMAAALEEARAACGLSADEFEGKVRGALAGALDIESLGVLTASAEKQGKKRARKNRKKGRQAEDADAGDR